MITLESGGMSYSKKIVYSISKIPISRNERKQTGAKGNKETYYGFTSRSRNVAMDL
jgi:hypothetical protein